MYDLLVIGGGINGVGVARDAAGRGLKVCLVEKDDLAAHTSSASTKLIHGGLRYLEHYEFRLVRESLKEREVLWRNAPHIIWPMRFVVPHAAGGRPAWMVRLGLFLYDHIGGREVLPATTSLDRATSTQFDPLDPSIRRAFEYSDCWVDDARLVVLNAVDARAKGADIRTRTKCVALEQHDDHWTAELHTSAGGREAISARMVVNAGGPWVARLARLAGGGKGDNRVRLVKGSHIILHRLFDGDQAYLFQHGDGRVIFAIPYEGGFTLVGTTDIPFEGDPGTVAISDDETAYLCSAINQYVSSDVTPADVVWAYSGVRPLFDDDSDNASQVTRDYHLELHNQGAGPRCVSIYGGKVTTYRKLAENVLDTLGVSAPGWTRAAPLPGGNMANGDFDAFLAGQLRRYPDLDPHMLRRLARCYGTRMDALLGRSEGLGKEIAPGLHEAELEWLVREEFAITAEDVLWRRTKLGLHFSKAEQNAVARYLS